MISITSSHKRADQNLAGVRGKNTVVRRRKSAVGRKLELKIITHATISEVVFLLGAKVSSNALQLHTEARYFRNCPESSLHLISPSSISRAGREV